MFASHSVRVFEDLSFEESDEFLGCERVLDGVDGGDVECVAGVVRRCEFVEVHGVYFTMVVGRIGCGMDFFKALDDGASRVLAAMRSHVLWPERYASFDAESARLFLTECCWTDDDETGEVALIPDLPFVRVLCEAYVETKRAGKPLVIEKSRRLLVSWIVRGLRLWSMGLRRETGVICGLTYPRAAEHVWRVAWLYKQLADRRPSMGLPRLKEGENTKGGPMLGKKLDVVILPNGSMVSSLNQEGESFQGSGYTWVDMEEASLYDDFGSMWSQAHTVTSGRADVPGGHIIVITNANGANAAWKERKAVKRVYWNQDPTWIPRVK